MSEIYLQYAMICAYYLWHFQGNPQVRTQQHTYIYYYEIQYSKQECSGKEKE